jgi:hypothetical protein
MSLIDLVEHYEFCLLSIRRREVELDGISLNSVKFTDCRVNLHTSHVSEG